MPDTVENIIEQAESYTYSREDSVSVFLRLRVEIHQSLTLFVVFRFPTIYSLMDLMSLSFNRVYPLRAILGFKMILLHITRKNEVDNWGTKRNRKDHNEIVMGDTSRLMPDSWQRHLQVMDVAFDGSTAYIHETPAF